MSESIAPSGAEQVNDAADHWEPITPWQAFGCLTRSRFIAVRSVGSSWPLVTCEYRRRRRLLVTNRFSVE